MKYLHHPTEGAKLFAEGERPEGWFSSPAEFGVITCPSQEQLAEMAQKAAEAIPEGVELADMSKEELLAFAEQRGIEVDKRLGVEKLRAVLNGDSP